MTAVGWGIAPGKRKRTQMDDMTAFERPLTKREKRQRLITVQIVCGSTALLVFGTALRFTVFRPSYEPAPWAQWLPQEHHDAPAVAAE